ncbi:HalD/BesD family halogenase [Pseudomonas sp. NPDC089569]|uniref:HalD/BesD family halogenase n=1 Tax=Pseudomonas sp. NPDC089569 TaxID=3390722 RepID=UPI003CFEB77E
MTTLAPTPVTLGNLVDLERYPITDRTSPAYQALVDHSRALLEQEGVAIFPGFARDETVVTMAEQTLALHPRMFHFREEHTVYFKPQVEGVDEAHPLRRLMKTEKDTVAYADIPADNLVRNIYESDDVLAFIKDVLGLDTLYRHADPLAALNLQGFTAGQQLGWHFDRAGFSVTLSLQAANAGGDFEYVRMLRNENDDCHEAVGQFLDDSKTQQVEVLPQVPGTLTLFRGRYSLHRVTPVEGDRLRLNAVLAYVDQPNVEFSAYARQLFYGRTSTDPVA